MWAPSAAAQHMNLSCQRCASLERLCRVLQGIDVLSEVNGLAVEVGIECFVNTEFQSFTTSLNVAPGVNLGLQLEEIFIGQPVCVSPTRSKVPPHDRRNGATFMWANRHRI